MKREGGEKRGENTSKALAQTGERQQLITNSKEAVNAFSAAGKP